MPGTRGTRDYTHERELALSAALMLHGPELFAATAQSKGVEAADKDLRGTATSIFRWLAGPVFLVLTIGPVTEQDTGEPVPEAFDGGRFMSQIRATQQFTAKVEAVDARGNVIGDQPGTQDDLSWTVEGDSVLTLDVSEDTREAVVKAAGPVGSAVVRVTAGEAFVTEAVDVVPGEIALIRITVGEVTEQETETPEEPGEGENPAPLPA